MKRKQKGEVAIATVILVLVATFGILTTNGGQRNPMKAEVPAAAQVASAEQK